MSNVHLGSTLRRCLPFSLAVTIATASIVAAVPSPARAAVAPDCSAYVMTPYRDWDRNIRSYTKTSCTEYHQLIAQVVEVYRWSGSQWVRVARGYGDGQNVKSLPTTYAVSQSCTGSGTKQYFAQSRFYTADCGELGCHQGWSPWQYKGPVFITC
jgi:hypothetical protein